MTEARSQAALAVTMPIVDLDADPLLPDGWNIEAHQKGGQFEWEASKVQLYLSEQQKPGEWIAGYKIHEELKGKPVFNANLLDYLLKNPLLIPEGWKGKYVFFWGTVYRHPDRGLCVRCLYCDGDGRWRWRTRWRSRGWHDDDPAAVSAG
jgi:hypothetical protein